MPFTVRNAINPANMAANWTTGVGRSGAKWAAGALNPRRLFNSNPAGAAQAWLTGVQAAQPKYQANLAATNLTTMEANINAVGIPRYQASATQKAAKFAAKTQALAAALTAGIAQLPADRSSTAARIARSTSMQTFMASQKGKI